MQEGAELREYAAGAAVTISLEVEHEFELQRPVARAVGVFQKQEVTSENFDPSREHTVVLQQSGIREHQRRFSPRWIHSTVNLEGRISQKTAPGEYRCEAIHAEFRDGRRVPFDLETVPEMRFRVVESPVNPPRVRQAQFRN